MIPGEPSNWCAPATDENKKYQNERLRVQIADAEATAKGKAKSSKLDAADMIRQTEKSISTDKILIARACAKKWGVAPTATDGTQPEFSEANRSEEHTSELQSLMRISYAVFCLTK